MNKRTFLKRLAAIWGAAPWARLHGNGPDDPTAASKLTNGAGNYLNKILDG